MTLNERAKQMCDAGECASMGEARRVLIIKGEAKFCIQCHKPFIPDDRSQDACSPACVRVYVWSESAKKSVERYKHFHAQAESFKAKPVARMDIFDDYSETKGA